MSLADRLGTSWDQCRSMDTSTATRRLRVVRTDSPGRPPRLSHSSSELTEWRYWYARWPIKFSTYRRQRRYEILFWRAQYHISLSVQRLYDWGRKGHLIPGRPFQVYNWHGPPIRHACMRSFVALHWSPMWLVRKTLLSRCWCLFCHRPTTHKRSFAVSNGECVCVGPGGWGGGERETDSLTERERGREGGGEWVNEREAERAEESGGRGGGREGTRTDTHKTKPKKLWSLWKQFTTKTDSTLPWRSR